jgi:hypothetical protein
MTIAGFQRRVDNDHASLLGILQALSAEQGAAIPAIAIT